MICKDCLHNDVCKFANAKVKDIESNLAFSNCKDFIDKNNSEKCGDWISVKERLPTEYGLYLVNLHQVNDKTGDLGNCVIEAAYHPCELFSISGDIGWQLLNEFYNLTDDLREYITHWMPWPEPPKGEE